MKGATVMKQLILAIAMVFCFTVSLAYADAMFGDHVEQGQGQGQAQGQLQGQDQDQLQLQGQAQKATAIQGQAMGQGQIGSVKTKVDNTIIEEDSDAAPDSIAFPSVSAAEGTQSATASYMFGNLGLSDTEMYKKGTTVIQTILAIPEDVLPAAEKQALVKNVLGKVNKSLRPRRLFGVLWEQHSKNALNLFGLLSWDSWWADGQRPLQSKSDIE